MYKFLAIAFSILLFNSCDAPQKMAFPETIPGVSEDLAEFRKQQMDSVTYDLEFEIPSELADSIPARLHLSVQLRSIEHPLVLDFQPNHKFPISGNVNGKETTFNIQKEHIVIPSEFLQIGHNDISLDFIAGERSLNRNKEYLFTLLVPDRARTLFPCFDQPNLKARYRLQISAPNDWRVMGPASALKTETQADRTVHYFDTSEPMSTYLFSFVAGSFDSVTLDEGDFPMEFFHMETDSVKANMSIPIVFELHRQSKDFLENYTQRNFPFQKLDFAAIFSHPYGGMEHVGAIQYLQQSLFLDSTATERQRLGRAKLIAHETAHMWFGDLVTMKWFDDVWMKEVFANFMADKIMNPLFTDVNHDLQFLTGHYPAAFSVDRTKGANAIRQSLENLTNAGSLYGDIIYHKAPIMMRQLEALLGEEPFRHGLATYIASYPFDNADWNDLIEILDKQTPLDLKSWSEVWVHSPGRPIVTSKLLHQNGVIQSFEITQVAEDGSDRIWPQVFEVALHYPDSTTILEVKATQKENRVVEAIGLPMPDSVTFNSNGMGYGVFPVGEGVTDIPSMEDEVMRGQAYINLYENTLIGSIDIEDSFEIFLKGMEKESNELILGLITGYVGNLYWTYTSDVSKKQLQPILEGLVFQRLRKDEAANIKKTLYNLYASIAHEGIGRDRLYAIWNKELSILNLKLNEDDFTSLAMTLALYNHPNSESILMKAEKELTNPNKLERFQFLKPALSADAAVRNAFFQSFTDEKNREKERWVSTACYYIHHPLRQESSLEVVPLSLEMLEEIQATGDIFFPKGWLDNTIGQYHSEGAWQLTEKFLDSHQNMDTKLRAKILQATDDLYRATHPKRKE